MSDKSPAFQWYVKEWLSSPTRLTMSRPQRSVYFDLLCYCWDSGECRLPSDESYLQKLVGCSKKDWPSIGPAVLSHFVSIGHGYITNRKLQQVWKERISFIESVSQHGRAGANARWHKQCPSNARAMPKNASLSTSASASASAIPKPSRDVAFESLKGSLPLDRDYPKLKPEN
jgi:uncharacterized protein YdaU (DUF1376 family)